MAQTVKVLPAPLTAGALLAPELGALAAELELPEPDDAELDELLDGALLDELAAGEAAVALEHPATTNAKATPIARSL